MITVKFEVTQTQVTVVEKSDRLISGNKQQIKCIFNLSEEYSGLIVRAVFNGEYRTLVNGECFAPELDEGICVIGVYGYSIENGKTIQRISPVPCEEYVYKGSYSDKCTEADYASPSELEAYYNSIKKLIDSGVLKGDTGPQGPKGEKGDKGDAGTSALNGGKLKDIFFVQNDEEYEELHANIETAFEEWQNGDYVLIFYSLESDDDGNPAFGVFTISKENEELIDRECFATPNISSEIETAVQSLKEKIDAIKPVIDINENSLVIHLEHNHEYRKFAVKIFGDYAWLQLTLPQNIPDDYISSLVFNSGATARTISYPQEIIFTGDDVIDNVFIPAANKTYNVMFWYDGININAVSRGVPYVEE